jgi:hypothetical protein
MVGFQDPGGVIELPHLIGTREFDRAKRFLQGLM